MKAQSGGRDSNPVAKGQSRKHFFPLLATASLVVLLLLARHTSTGPEILGRWSPGFAALLAIQALATLSLTVLCFPALRKRILKRSEWLASRRKAWAQVLAMLAALVLFHALLRNWIFPAKDPIQALIVAFLLIFVVSLTLLMMWRNGSATLIVRIRLPLLFFFFIVVNLLLVSLFLGKAPPIAIWDETQAVGTSVRQFLFPDRFIHLRAHRNASTWFYNLGMWVLTGGWLNIFGVGILQARFFSLLVAWLGVPFLYLTASKLSGRKAAYIAAVLGLALPLHFVTARPDVWVATAFSIALCCYVHARNPEATRPGLLCCLCGFFAFSSVDGHPYGIAFTLMFCVLFLPSFIRMIRGNGNKHAQNRISGFVAGCAGYLVLWIMYHIALPGVNLAAIPQLLNATIEYETSMAGETSGPGRFSEYALRLAHNLLYYHPYAAVLTLFSLVVCLLKGRKEVHETLLFAAGVAVILLILMAHFSPHYLVFFLPFVCLWSGTGLSALFPASVKPYFRNGPQWPLGPIYFVSAFLLLGTIQLTEIATLYTDSLKSTRAFISIGQEIDRMLPDENIVVAGTVETYLGMTWRMNYGGSCGFTWGDDKSWPLDSPRAVIYTQGWDMGCDSLPEWLNDHDFRPARCFTGHDLGEGTTVLFLPADLTRLTSAIDCLEQDLMWMEDQ